MNVLVIDDDILVIKSIDRVLKMNGYKVDLASSGQEALDLVKEHEYDITLSGIVTGL